MYDPKGSKTAQRCKDSIVVFALPGPSTAPTSSPVHHQAPFVHSKSTPRFQKPQLSSTVQSSMTGVTVGVRGTSVCMFLTCTCKKKHYSCTVQAKLQVFHEFSRCRRFQAFLGGSIAFLVVFGGLWVGSALAGSAN